MVISKIVTNYTGLIGICTGADVTWEQTLCLLQMLKPNFNFIKNYFILLNAEVWFNETLALELDVKWQWLRAAGRCPTHSGPAPKPQITLFMKKIGLFLSYPWKSGMRMWKGKGFVKLHNWVKAEFGLVIIRAATVGLLWQLMEVCAWQYVRCCNVTEVRTRLKDWNCVGGRKEEKHSCCSGPSGPTSASGTSTLSAHTWVGPGA